MAVREWTDERFLSHSNRGEVATSNALLDLTFSSPELLEEHDGVWILRDVETGIFGSGPDPDGANQDFQAALREHRDVLESQAALSDDLQAQLQYLRRRLG
jgi:hypothetical protein